MNLIKKLIISDLQQIFRDKTMTIFMFAPLLLISFVRFFVPIIGEKYPVIVEYYPNIMMFGTMQTSIMFGFIVSFMILEEKDENVLQVIRVLPISPFYFLLYRFGFATVFSSLGAWLMITFGDLVQVDFLASLALTAQYGLAAPFIALIIATYAQNKVEGMAFFKGVNLVLIIPMVSFFLTGIWKYLFVLIPVYWTYGLFQAFLKSENVIFELVMGFLVYGVVLRFLFVQFKEKVFDR